MLRHLQEKPKQMSTPKRKIIFNIFLIAALALSGKAEAGLYGFTTGKDPTVEEEILDMPAPPQNILNYRSLMRDNLQMLIDYAKENKPEFQIMLHDCDEMLYKSLWEYHLTGYSHARGNNDDKSDPSFLSYTNDELEKNILEFDADAYKTACEKHYKELGGCETGKATQLVCEYIYRTCFDKDVRNGF